MLFYNMIKINNQNNPLNNHKSISEFHPLKYKIKSKSKINNFINYNKKNNKSEKLNPSNCPNILFSRKHIKKVEKVFLEDLLLVIKTINNLYF
jgi:hypothetical protein